jgi:hypothetical protein
MKDESLFRPQNNEIYADTPPAAAFARRSFAAKRNGKQKKSVGLAYSKIGITSSHILTYAPC